MTWLTDDKNRRTLILVLAGMAFLISVVFLNRWFITEKGIYSFGRLWHYYISYSDFGFSKRALFGTFLTELGLNKIFANEYVFAYIIYTLKLALLTFLVLYFCLKTVPFDNLVGYAVVFLSPAFILHSAYTSGSQDLQLLILMTTLILFVRRDVTLAVLSCIGVLMHDLFIFFLPAIFLLHVYRSAPAWRITKRKIAKVVLPALPVIITILTVLSFGRIDVQRASYYEMMAERLPKAAYWHSWWSGYKELSYSLPDERRRSVVRELPGAAGYIAIPMAYVLSLALVLAFYLRESTFFFRLSVFLVSIFPLFAAFFGRDFYRWVGMSANVSLLLLVCLSASRRIRVPVVVFLLFLAFSCFAPFGAAILERPFPAHQLLFEKFSETTKLKHFAVSSERSSQYANRTGLTGFSG